MAEDIKEIEAIFKIFVEAVLMEYDMEKSLSVITDDVIGIGMGNQGIVSGKEDLFRILSDGKKDTQGAATTVCYDKIQIRCYEGKFGSICGVLKITTTENGEKVESALGQMLGVRKENGRWLAYAVQATPLFDKIEEMEAYPIKFAENALEKYRQQEQIAKNAQKDSIAIYKVNFTEGVFEESVLKNDMLIPTVKGDSYEQITFQSARRYLNAEECYEFISTFSLGNIIKLYNSGQTEISMEYRMAFSEDKTLWMRTTAHIYMDKTDGNLKGYLYVFDIDEEKRKKIELQSRVEKDPMTDIYNRKYSEIRINEKLKNAAFQEQGVFFMLDLDYFKEINDTYGHQRGDMVIKKTVKCMKSLMHKDDIAGRLGGDEFCIYFHGPLPSETVVERADLLCSQIRGIIQPGKTDKAGTSCSIGIVYCNKPGLTFAEIYKMADEALYMQKKKGRDGYTILKMQEQGGENFD